MNSRRNTVRCRFCMCLHRRDGDDIGEDDQENDVAVVVAEVAVPVVDGAGGAVGLNVVSGGSKM